MGRGDLPEAPGVLSRTTRGRCKPVSRKTGNYHERVASPIGALLLIFSGEKLTEIGFGQERIPYPKGRAPESLKKQLKGYFEGRTRVFDQDIVFHSGTEFEQKVWLALKEIPYGETRTYKWLAERVGHPKAVRAVGRALSKNPIPIVLPCHRIIESDGSLGGYSGGIAVKRRLLDLEYYALQSETP